MTQIGALYRGARSTASARHPQNLVKEAWVMRCCALLTEQLRPTDAFLVRPSTARACSPSSPWSGRRDVHHRDAQARCRWWGRSSTEATDPTSDQPRRHCFARCRALASPWTHAPTAGIPASRSRGTTECPNQPVRHALTLSRSAASLNSSTAGCFRPARDGTSMSAVDGSAVRGQALSRPHSTAGPARRDGMERGFMRGRNRKLAEARYCLRAQVNARYEVDVSGTASSRE